MKEELAKIAYSVFEPILRASSEHDGTFKVLMTTFIGGKTQPLLILGNAHARIEDGACIAVLNPDKSLFDELRAGSAYNEALLKEIVAGKCDEMVYLWFDAYKHDKINIIGHYRARSPRAATFEVR